MAGTHLDIATIYEDNELLVINKPTWKYLEEVEQTLPALGSMPIKLIWGMRDWCFQPSCLDRLVEPNAEVERFDDIGHWVTEEARQRVHDSVSDFLERTGEPASRAKCDDAF